MHFAEFAPDEVIMIHIVDGESWQEQSKALLEAIKEYDANKWKAIGAKLNKPAKVIITIMLYQNTRADLQ